MEPGPSGYDIEPLASFLGSSAPRQRIDRRAVVTDPSAAVSESRRDRTVRYVSYFNSEQLQALFRVPDRFVDDPGAIRFKHDTTSTLTLTSFDGRQIVVKRFNLRNPWHALRRAPRATRASNCWEAARQLTALGIATARPVATVELRYGPFYGRGYYVSEYVAGDLLSDVLRRGLDSSLVQSAVDGVVGALRTMWSHGLSHGDTKATNFVITPWSRTVILDLDAVRAHRRAITLRRAVARDQQRFLRNLDHDPRLRREVEREFENLTGSPNSMESARQPPGANPDAPAGLTEVRPLNR